MNQEMDELAGPPLAEDLPEPVAWEDPALSRFRGFGRTLGQLLFRPGEFFANLARTHDDSGAAEPFAFGLIAGTVGFLGSMFWYLVLWAAAGRTVAVGTETPRIFSAGAGAALVLFALSPVLVMVNLAICALGLWVGTAMLGGQRGIKAAWRTGCYAQGVLVLGLIPFLGAPVAGILVLFLLYLGAQSLITPAAPVRTLAAWLIFMVITGCCWGLLTGGLLSFLGLLGFLLFLGGG
jgi:hypothetical protein